ncbi:hypothetical protein GJAV_G00063890 [Gymnothorax javanicus]|nr:hypothetical protein GJAV_G00063890 [Gymnothorax javanicus]
MEPKRYQSLFESNNAEPRWPHAPNTDDRCATVDGNPTNCSILTEAFNVNSGLNVTDSFMKNDGDMIKQLPLCAKKGQPLTPPGLNSCIKQDADSKELSKTVAESMGLYMNDVRDVDYGYGQQRGHEGHYGSQKLYAVTRPCVEGSQGSPQLTPHLPSCPAVPHIRKSPADGSLGVSQGSSSWAPAVCCSPQNSHSSLSSPTSLASSIASPFGNPRSSVDSPVQQAVSGPSIPRMHPRLPTSCSPSNAGNIGSPLSSPHNVLRSPISSPRSISSVRSPQSCGAALKSSAPSPAGANCNHIHAHPPRHSSPGVANAATTSSPFSSTGLPVSSPDSALGLGLVQIDGLSPRERGRESKGFEFPKVENEDGELCSVGLNQMGMVKFIKNEPDPEGRSMCLALEKRRTTSSTLSVQIKTEPNKGSACLPYDQQQHSLDLFPETETTYLSLRDNIDEYSLSGILGPPVSTQNGSYEPGVFSNIALQKAIKQELSDGCYYPENSSVPTSAIVGVNSGGHSFHYQIGAQGAMSLSRHAVKDETSPLLNLISPIMSQVETWKPHPDLSQGPLSSRGGGYAGQNYFTDNMSSANLRHTSIGSSATKVCLVCGDEASGCHYGVVTCGSCKVFFKRAVEGQHSYLCAGRNDCIIDKIRRKNCPACRVRKCLQAGMNLGARKSKKLGKLKVVSEEGSLQGSKEGQICLASEKELVPGLGGMTSYLPPSISGILEIIEPQVVYAGYDNTQPDTTDHLLSSLNQLGGKQMIHLVKWAKVLPGFRGLPIEDQITLIQYSWMCLSSFALSWRSYKHTNGQMLYFAPDLIFNEQRMKQSAMYELCVGMRQVSQEFVRLQLTYEEFLSMKVLLLLSTIPKEGLKNQPAFEEMRMNYIKELRRSVAKATSTSGQTWHRFFQLTKLMDAMHDLVGNLLDFCFYTFRESQALKVEFPEMLVEIISDQIPKVESGLTHTLFFHK